MEESRILDESLSIENGFRLDQGFCYFQKDGLDIRNNRFSFSNRHKAGFRQWFIGVILPSVLIIGYGIMAYKGFVHNRSITLNVFICFWLVYVFFIRIAMRPSKIFIPKNAITRIKHNSAIRFFSKGYFVIRYMQNEKEKRTILILPGILNNDIEEKERAIRLLKENNYNIE